MEDTKMVNHWGHWVDVSKPVTGVIGFNDVCQFTCDEIAGGDSIDLSYEDAKKEFQEAFALEHEGAEPSDEDWDQWYESMEGYESGDMLIGDWITDEDGLYAPDPEGEYSAIVREDVIQVVLSKYITKCKFLCSPCYPGQADVRQGKDEEGGEFLAYNLPPEAYDY